MLPSPLKGLHLQAISVWPLYLNVDREHLFFEDATISFEGFTFIGYLCLAFVATRLLMGI
jgi:hypothetical protein